MYIKRVILVPFVLLAIVSHVSAEDIDGRYHCQGTNADGSIYTGEVQIEARGDAFIVTWDLHGQKHRGIGLFDHGVLSATWTMQANPNAGGVIAYRRLDNGQLQGRWVTVSGGTDLQRNADANSSEEERYLGGGNIAITSLATSSVAL